MSLSSLWIPSENKIRMYALSKTRYIKPDPTKIPDLQLCIEYVPGVIVEETGVVCRADEWV